jgi:hypothetical protein
MRLVDVLLLVRDLQTRHPGALQTPVPIRAVREYITESTRTRFEILRNPAIGQQMTGTIQRYNQGNDRHARIFVAQSLNRCYSRFVRCKEMSHVLIDKDGTSMSTDVRGHLAQMIVTNFSPDEDIRSEILAWFAAIEILIPWAHKKKILDMAGNGKVNIEIAQKYMVPKIVVDHWRHPRYQILMETAWSGTV